MVEKIADRILEVTGQAISITGFDAISGGSINKAYTLHTQQHCFFVKTNRASLHDMFVAEAAGLQELRRSKAVNVPQVICHGTYNAAAYLVLEHIALAKKTGRGEQKLGKQLAAMHRFTAAQFGWYRDNYIGSTPQANQCKSDWVSFMQQQRLAPQLQMAVNQGYAQQLQEPGQRLIAALPVLFSDYQPAASLLHGDLWSGNAAVDTAGKAWIFDPAVYYGDREADIALTELFNGFSKEFYQSYASDYALDPGYSVRKNLYNLYHVLNHAKLFGSHYVGQARRMMMALLAEIG